MVTGEAVPVEKQPGDELIGGAVNGDGAMRMTVKRTGDETFLSQVMVMVRKAQASKSKTQRFADTVAKWLFYIAVSTGLLTFAVWMALGYGLSFAVTRAVTVIVICCPHALGLAIPLVTSVSTSIGANQGLLIRNRTAFENARNLTTVVFDKTGTLTEGRFGVTDVDPEDITEDELLALAASAESESEHPIAKGIVEEAKKRGASLTPVKDMKTLPGKGLQASVDGSQVMVVSPGYLQEQDIAYDRDGLNGWPHRGKRLCLC